MIAIENRPQGSRLHLKVTNETAADQLNFSQSIRDFYKKSDRDFRFLLC